ncbi:hypothetical protein [Sphingomonas aerolata]|uniref:hypothetical protein n=1 Tax=Sphingomonas aerolata TaxID=185951 RepID=UPI00141AA22D|nr:hypothetical protein [Sphingomonas aerolata]
MYDRASMAHALTLDLDPTLLRLLKDRVSALGEALIDWTEYLVVEPGDTEADIIRHVGFSPLIEPIDGKRFGALGFHKHWDWLSRHDRWFEMIVTFGSTFAYVLFIPDGEMIPEELLKLCREYSKP